MQKLLSLRDVSLQSELCSNEKRNARSFGSTYRTGLRIVLVISDHETSESLVSPESISGDISIIWFVSIHNHA